MTKEHYLNKDVAAQWRVDIRQKVNDQAIENNKLTAGKELSDNIKYLRHIYNLKVQTIDLIFQELEQINGYILEEVNLTEEAK